jgi:hypothetical protein
MELKETYYWFVKFWRPAMAWSYCVICLFDFLFAPLLWELLHYLMKLPPVPWQPITLQGGAIYHISMGAIVGVSAWSRTLEKITMMKTGTPGTDPELLNESSDPKR